MADKINPIKLYDKDNGKTYELDFSRESVVFAEDRGFKLSDVAEYPVSKIPEFFYYAFRKNNRELSRGQTNALFDRLGGVSAEVVERLVSLYNQAALSNTVVDSTEDMGKNGGMAVEL